MLKIKVKTTFKVCPVGKIAYKIMNYLYLEQNVLGIKRQNYLINLFNLIPGKIDGIFIIVRNT